MGTSSKKPRGKGWVEIFCKYIRKNGKIIYPTNAKYFHFWVKQK